MRNLRQNRSVFFAYSQLPILLIHDFTSWVAAMAKRKAGPSAPGSKSIPEHADPDCLAGLSFVFTGELSAFSRDEVIEVAKRFGG